MKKDIPVFPKQIWMYWDQGFLHCPEVISQCVKRWQALHPEWTINLLDRYSARSFVAGLPLSETKFDQLSLAHRSDLIRTKLLIEHGGVWADPTVFCVQKLDVWLSRYLDSGLFLFRKPGRDRLVSNWFIAAEKDHPILVKLLQELCDYWQTNDFVNHANSRVWYFPLLCTLINRSLWSPRIWFNPSFNRVFRVYPYMVYHYKFFDVLYCNSQLRLLWNLTPTFPAELPHRLQRYGLLTPLTADVRKWIDLEETPVHKLSWKLKVGEVPDGSVLKYLFSKYY